MADTFKARDGKSLKDGDRVELTLMYDNQPMVHRGTIRAFDHVERVYDEEGIAVGKTTDRRWELVLDPDPSSNVVAIGFLPENVASAKE